MTIHAGQAMLGTVQQRVEQRNQAGILLVLCIDTTAAYKQATLITPNATIV